MSRPADDLFASVCAEYMKEEHATQMKKALRLLGPSAKKLSTEQRQDIGGHRTCCVRSERSRKR